MTRKAMLIVGIVIMSALGFAGQQGSAQEKKLVLWSHWGMEPVKVNFMNAVAAQFSHTSGIPVEIVWVNKPDLLQKLPLALDNTEPDITYLDGGFTHPRIGRSLVNLSDLQFTGQIDSSWEFGTLGEYQSVFLPIEGIANGIYYNKHLLNQAQITLPQERPLTADEFLDVIKKLRAAGITPIGEGAADVNIKIGLPLMNTIFRYAGPEKMTQLYDGTLPFSDPDVATALAFWQQVVAAQAYDPQKALTLDHSDGIFEVVDGKAALSFCGTFFYSKYGATERDQGHIGVMDWFTVPEGKGNLYYELLWGAGFGANKHSAHLAEAKQFLAYLMSPAAASLWIKYVQTPYPVKAGDVAPESLYNMLFKQRTGQQPSPALFAYTLFPSKARQQMWELETRKFITGEQTIKQFIERMDSRLE